MSHAVVHFFVKGTVLTTLLFALTFVPACRPQEDVCDSFCSKSADCAEIGDQPFSVRVCERDCLDDMDRYKSVDCEDPFADVMDCQAGLSCGNWSEVMTHCDHEVEYLDACLR
ncbi:MAG: hypothetical protein MUC50_16810 [Myxococcota bacterium]|nr:hypothetical protein [Myxococcota bacterium]